MEIKYPGGVFDTVQRHSQHMLYHWLKIQAQSCPCFKHYIKSYTICLYAWVALRNSLIALFYLLHEHVVILLPIFHWLCTVCFVLFLHPKAMDIMVKDVSAHYTRQGIPEDQCGHACALGVKTCAFQKSSLYIALVFFCFVHSLPWDV